MRLKCTAAALLCAAAAAVSLVPVSQGAAYQEAPCAGKFGQCQQTSGRKCKGGHFEKGLCPTQSDDDVQCCVPDDLFGDKGAGVPLQSTKCLIQGGRCQNVKEDKCDNGRIDYASCHGQGVDVKCCVKNFYLDAAQPYQETACMVEGGECKHTRDGDKCDDGKWRYGKCIRQPLVECCVKKDTPVAKLHEVQKESPFQENECMRLGGRCLPYRTGLEKCDNGAWQYGKCILQPAVQCCVPKFGVNSSQPFQETECAKLGGRCQTVRTPCAGQYKYSLYCPAQVAQAVHCCVDGASSGGGICRPEPPAKLKAYFRDLFYSRENCSDSTFDQRNWYDGRLGMTCLGVTPEMAWRRRRAFSCRGGRRRSSTRDASDFRTRTRQDRNRNRGRDSGDDGDRAAFLQRCYERDREAFEEDAHALYESRYQKECMAFKMPAYYACIDVLVSAGPEAAADITDAAVAQRGASNSDKAMALAINTEHMKWIEAQEIQGMLSYQTVEQMRNRVNERNAFVEGYMKGAC